MKSKALDAVLRYFDVNDNQLMVGKRPITEWTRKFGTPLYLYDSDVIRKKVRLFREAMPDSLKLEYAIKANPNEDLLAKMVSLVDGFDVASIGELERVLQAGADPKNISFAGPGKRKEEIKKSIEIGIGSINIESERELTLVAEEAKVLRKNPRISIRINPDFEIQGAGMRMGGGPKQFGIDADQVPKIIKRIQSMKVNFQGFHVYAGSQNLKAEVICEVLEKTIKLVDQVSGPIKDTIKLLNLGGGFGIPYFQNDEALDIERIGKCMHVLLVNNQPKYPGARFVIELGRYLVGESGIYVTKVLYKKQSQGKTFLITDGGMNHHLAASGNFGQVLRKNYPILVGNRVYDSETEQVDIVGPLCTPLDLIGSKVDLPEVIEGDLIVIMTSGAYGFTASPIHFLSHPPPTEIVV